jgi:hypothetical protein
MASLRPVEVLLVVPGDEHGGLSLLDVGLLLVFLLLHLLLVELVEAIMNWLITPGRVERTLSLLFGLQFRLSRTSCSSHVLDHLFALFVDLRHACISVELI